MSDEARRRMLAKIRELVDKAIGPLDFVGGWVNQLEQEIDKMRAKIDKQADEVLRIDARREQEICERDRRIAELERGIEEQTKEIERLQGELKACEEGETNTNWALREKIKKLYERIRTKDKRIAELEHQLDHDLHAEGRLASIKALSDALARAEKENAFLSGKIDEMAATIAELTGLYKNANIRIENLRGLCRGRRPGVALSDINTGDMVDIEVDEVGWRVTVRPAKAGDGDRTF